MLQKNANFENIDLEGISPLKVDIMCYMKDTK